MPVTTLIPNYANLAPVPNEDAVPIWRYMKLSTLLLLLEEGKAFFPSVKKLKDMDRLEGEMLLHEDILSQRSCWRAIQSDSQWFLDNAVDPQTIALLSLMRQDPTYPFDTRKDILRSYRDHLIKRRCVWCGFVVQIKTTQCGKFMERVELLSGLPLEL